MLLGDLGGWAPDLEADLAFHRAVLQTVQHGQPPKRWLLKTPGYLMMLDDLLAAYPDACIIQTHRDPAKTMPSTASTVAMIQWLRTDHVDLDLHRPAGRRRLRRRPRPPSARRRLDGSLAAPFGDARFADLMADPVAAIAGAYAGIGRELTDEHAPPSRTTCGDKPRGKHGTHRYTAEDWGFDPDALHAELARLHRPVPTSPSSPDPTELGPASSRTSATAPRRQRAATGDDLGRGGVCRSGPRGA